MSTRPELRVRGQRAEPPAPSEEAAGVGRAARGQDPVAALSSQGLPCCRTGVQTPGGRGCPAASPVTLGRGRGGSWVSFRSVNLLLALPLQLFLPSMRKKPALADGSSPDGDLVQEHWLVDDMFVFENVGFTKDVGNVKFLVCADCEIGPIGWHCLDDKNRFYVALERVSHE